MIVTAKQINVPMSPKKLARVVEVVKGHTASKALDELKLLPKKGAFYAYKVISSAVANAEHNFKLDTAKLIVSKIWVTDGMKRLRKVRFASRGRVSFVRKYRSNLYVELSYGK
ncbi:MAG: 50S ribosomal protein L22 [Candidatus Dojkabacteria bacterium]|nr:MAG: 50S ribosomal protein L22 [Candidatus Dojkabacteria bacterium]